MNTGDWLNLGISVFGGNMDAPLLSTGWKQGRSFISGWKSECSKCVLYNQTI
jgi:hypothetical protein